MKNNKTNRNSRHSKAIIDTYETIYSVDIIVANKHSTLEQLKKILIYSDGIELDEGILQCICTVSTCKRLSDNKYCILVKYNRDSGIKSVDKKLDFINTVCHESGHVVLDIYRYMEELVDTNHQEMFCYLLGHVGECIYKTLTKK